MFTQFSSEAVAAGHPDKICDQIADAIVDACLEQDSNSRVAVEALVTKNKLFLAGEVSCQGEPDYAAIARQRITQLGYINPDWGFSAQSPIDIRIHRQSSEIAQGVDLDGAGDQGMMFGYACQETPELMPLPIMLAQQLVKNLDRAREKKTLPYLRPDGKAQVVIDYEEEQPVRVATVIMAAPHSEAVELEDLKLDLWREVIKPAIKKYLPEQNLKQDQPQLIINGTGAWHIGGPASDTGLTGRKIMVDTYGGMGRHGGGAFSGKDATKVDRSAAYGARFLAKNIVAQGLAKRCEVQADYAIGQSKPVILAFETFGTAKVKNQVIKDFANNLLDMSVKNIIDTLDLRQPIFAQTAIYGHFGRSEFSWEKMMI